MLTVFEIPNGANVFYAMNWKSNNSLIVLLENGVELSKLDMIYIVILNFYF